MAYSKVTYRVIGRYMDGRDVKAYHFIGSDDKNYIYNKETTIYMIGKGLVENMRISTCDGEIIIRGKGINLNKLPVYDETKQQYRNVSNNDNKTSESMGMLTITKRIMHKTNCIGYVLRDIAGNEKKLKRADVLNLVADKKVTNATLSRTINKETGMPVTSLRGIDCALKKLPILILNESGKIIDPLISNNETIIRAVRMKTSGVIRELVSNSVKRFSAGDFLIIQANGELDTIAGTKFSQKYEYDKTHGQATCDYYLDRLDDFSVEMYGCKEIKLKPEQVKGFAMAKYR